MSYYLTIALELWNGAVGIIQWLAQLFGTHLEKLVGLAGFSFGIWRWWYHRERVLHRRLQEYLAEQDRRLDGARSYVLEAIFRPGAKRRFFGDPLFVVQPLRSLLRREGWDSLLGIGRIETAADRSLDTALGRIERRLETATATLTSLRMQRASAFLLKGAVASARAQLARDPVRRADLDDRALVHFRAALGVSEHDLQAKEYEAHQLRKLGHLTEAAAAYERLEALAEPLTDARRRDLLLAVARRHRAEILQAQAIMRNQRDPQETLASGVANTLINNALALRARYGPFRGWDAIEQGELHFLSAYVCHNLSFVQQAPNQLGLAGTAYNSVLTQTTASRFSTRSTRRLRAAALGGLERVQRVRTTGEYDEKCLLPPLDGANQ